MLKYHKYITHYNSYAKKMFKIKQKSFFLKLCNLKINILKTIKCHIRSQNTKINFIQRTLNNTQSIVHVFLESWMLKIILLLIVWDNLDIDHAAHICYFYHTIMNCLVVISKYCWIYKNHEGGLLPIIASYCFKMTFSNNPPHSRAHQFSHSFAFTCCLLQPDEVSLSQ